METVYKLTDGEYLTCNDMRWGEGVTHTADRSRPPVLCSAGVIHAYRHPLLAAFFSPNHGAAAYYTVLWEATTPEVVTEGIDKLGCREVTTVGQVPLPVLTAAQRVEVAIRVSLLVPQHQSYVDWANSWLDGTDRSPKAAWEAAEAAWAAEAAEAARAADYHGVTTEQVLAILTAVAESEGSES